MSGRLENDIPSKHIKRRKNGQIEILMSIIKEKNLYSTHETLLHVLGIENILHHQYCQ